MLLRKICRTLILIIFNFELGTLLDLIDEAPSKVNHMEQIFTMIIDLGKKCTLSKAEDRLDMVEVLKILENTFTFTT